MVGEATLADEQPTAGQRGEELGPSVAVPDGAWGIDDAGSTIVPGPFLVRPNPEAGDDGPAWQIVARYDPLRSVRVVIP